MFFFLLIFCYLFLCTRALLLNLVLCICCFVCGVVGGGGFVLCFLFKDKIMICLNDLYICVEGIIHFCSLFN